MNFEIFKKDFINLLDKCLELVKQDNKKVIVLSIPDWNVTPSTKFKDKIRNELKTYNANLQCLYKRRNRKAEYALH
ncbi:hypothetical protein [uncultured Croceitalea sp.]|uniref:hypothetical protein n=1 Tax=uncultured Croceitalea sp. TaxID=1798908 RepID=UPI00374F8B88